LPGNGLRHEPRNAPPGNGLLHVARRPRGLLTVLAT